MPNYKFDAHIPTLPRIPALDEKTNRVMLRNHPVTQHETTAFLAFKAPAPPRDIATARSVIQRAGAFVPSLGDAQDAGTRANSHGI